MEKDILIGKAFKDAWQGMKKHWIVLMGIFVVFFVVIFVIQMLFGAKTNTTIYSGEGIMDIYQQTMLQMQGQVLLNIFTTLTGVAFLVIIIPIILDCARGKELVFRFAFGKYLSLLLFSVVCAVIAFCVAAFLGFLAIFMGFLAFILIIPVGLFLFYVLLRICFYSFVYLDEENKLSLWDAVKESWRITKGNEINIILFFLGAIGIIILGLIALVVGLLLATPLVYLAMAFVYLQLVERNKIEPAILFTEEKRQEDSEPTIEFRD